MPAPVENVLKDKAMQTEQVTKDNIDNLDQLLKTLAAIKKVTFQCACPPTPHNGKTSQYAQRYD